MSPWRLEKSPQKRLGERCRSVHHAIWIVCDHSLFKVSPMLLRFGAQRRVLNLAEIHPRKAGGKLQGRKNKRASVGRVRLTGNDFP